MGTTPQNSDMTRSERWRLLLILVRDTFCNGNQAQLARLIEKDGSYVNRLFWLPEKSGAKGVGPEVIDACNRAFNLPTGFWDMEPEQAGKALNESTSIMMRPTASAPHEAPAQNPSDPPDLVIAEYNTGGAMGHGFALEENPPGLIRSWRVTHDWLRLNVPVYTSIENLCIVTGFGPSMKPRYNPGDPLLCDRGVRNVEVDGVYFFRVDGHGFIKQLQRIPTENGLILRAKSFNKDYDPFDITKKMDFEVFGKILTAWRSEQF